VNLAKEISHGLKSAVRKKDGSIYFTATISKEAFSLIINNDNAENTEEKTGIVTQHAK
jgi:hypothetical protein